MSDNEQLKERLQGNVSTEDSIVGTVLAAYPNTRAIYLFGSWGTEDEWPASDVDIALLLPPEVARRIGSLAMSDLQFALEDLLKNPRTAVALPSGTETRGAGL